MAAVALNESPASVLRSLRGTVIAARKAYPDVLHLEIRDSRGELWRLATQDADWFPSDPSELLDLSIEDAELDERTGDLRLGTSSGSDIKVVSAAHESEDDPANWKLFTPGGLVLIFGPGGEWRFKRSDDRVAASHPVGASPDTPIRMDDLSEALEYLASRQFQFDKRDHARNQLTAFAFGFAVAAMVTAVVALVLAIH